MKVALIQQPASENVEANIQLGLDNLDQAAAKGAKLAIFAELAFTPFYPQYLADGDITHLAEQVPGPITEKYIDWAVAGLPTSKKLKPLEIITKKDCSFSTQAQNSTN